LPSEQQRIGSPRIRYRSQLVIARTKAKNTSSSQSTECRQVLKLTKVAITVSTSGAALHMALSTFQRRRISFVPRHNQSYEWSILMYWKDVGQLCTSTQSNRNSRV